MEAIAVELSEKLLCLFNAEVEEADGNYVVRIPDREVESGAVESGQTYRVAVVARGTGDGLDEGDRSDRPGRTRRSRSESPPAQPQPPVEQGEIRYVEIEDLGKQGDGIARVERGYVIIVPGTEVGERVKIEIAEVKSNFAVGEVLDDTFE